jgi:hypothetical protein
MTVMRTLKKLLFGETWLLPAGLAGAIAVSVAIRRIAGSDWNQVGGFVLLACVLVVVLWSASRSAPRRKR